MKRLFFAVAIVVLAATAAFADAVSSDVLITTDGAVYTVAVEPSEDGLSSSLMLTVQSGGKETRSLIPSSNNGMNLLPNLAYDAETKSVFVVWSRMSSIVHSELVVAQYRNSNWAEVAVIDSKPAVRSNLGIRLTRKVRALQQDGTYAPTAALILHAAWWDKSDRGESAYYAVMPLSAGYMNDPDVHDLTEFVNAAGTHESPITKGFMRHVALVDGPTPDAVDVIYSDNRTNSFYRTTLRPIAEIRVHITVGVKGPTLGVPKQLSFDWSGRTSTITSPDGNTIIFCNKTDDKVMWVTLRDGKWLPVKELSLSDKFNADAAMAALAKMAASPE